MCLITKYIKEVILYSHLRHNNARHGHPSQLPRNLKDNLQNRIARHPVICLLYSYPHKLYLLTASHHAAANVNIVGL